MFNSTNDFVHVELETSQCKCYHWHLIPAVSAKESVSISQEANINSVFCFPPAAFVMMGRLPVDSGHSPVKSPAASGQEMEGIFPLYASRDNAGVTHLSSETFLPAAHRPADTQNVIPQEGGEAVRKGLGLSHLWRNPISMATVKTPKANFMKSTQTSKSYWMPPPTFQI